jgi:hypothetical protein
LSSTTVVPLISKNDSTPVLISDSLVFVELQKTGSDHIKSLLKKTVGGENDAKNNVPDEALLASGRQFIGSIRDPWAWYLSLWTVGCQQKGELYERLTNPKKWRKLLEKGEGEADAEVDAEDAAPEADAAAAVADDGAKAKSGKLKPKVKAKVTELPEFCTPERAKDFWYADVGNAEAFREWLLAILTVPAMRNVAENGYGKSPIARIGGLMTYRYFTLFTKDGASLDKSVSSLEALQAHDQAQCYINHFIRHESLAADFLKTMDALGVEMTPRKRELVNAPRPTSTAPTRPHPIEYYYDKDSSALVARRDKFIVDKFGYKHHRP